VLKNANVVAKIAKGGYLIDAAGPGRKVYQVSVSRDHEMPAAAMEKNCKELGFIDQAGKLVSTTEGEMEPRKLEFYWVVPMAQAASWKKKAPKTYRTTERKELDKCLEMYVNQYALPLTIEVPPTYSEWNNTRSNATVVPE
jgi:hypothetical protein